jgi:hypothetical protein
MLTFPLPTEDLEATTCKPRYYRNIYLEGLKKSMKTLSRIAKSQKRYQFQALSLYQPVNEQG